MVSAPEVKRIALAIEEELFAYYAEANTKYKHKFRTLITHLKDPKNMVSSFCIMYFLLFHSCLFLLVILQLCYAYYCADI